MIILGIETSCDETSIAFVKASGGLRAPRFSVLSNVVSSQVKLHAPYGGVMPLLAARQHGKNIGRVFKLACRYAGNNIKPNLIAVTRGPGLMPSLLVGVYFARSLSYFSNIPIIGVNHLEGHIYSNWLEQIGVKSKLKIPNSKHTSFPALALIVSGGHTELLLMKNHGSYTRIGETLDDAAGECFDKVARLLGLGYPGGPIIDTLAKTGNARAYIFPSPMIHAKNFDFSFSGLKTSMLYFLRDRKLIFSQTKLSSKRERMRADIAASFQRAVVRVLVFKTLAAAKQYKVKTILVGGGVAANSGLQNAFRIAHIDYPVIFPKRAYITDNAAMVAAAGYIAYASGRRDTWKTLEPDANAIIQEKVIRTELHK
ncbi:MAG: tRNA (adenosine(37)-N6)-threonylcarbamoyltransferase complex transferase subunit TsaD [Candidatus Brennerbacteria bacterium CG11_big_fil_rev_8_21_14_0_20_43_10]|uniref:tRNA N6-adenosine threonylcarbamoyltransferase n=3 Tax=Candidatus Brenneribacteriota TaxID=1817902 RepID=A0A2M8C3K0_9BACT|nr:MAG: tRNA (adenosine(37)-N6)-threonylcarbamoyltransferase complex transferase subunit TsaD [Parcubacteria group bacterium CG1_02_44_31]PIP50214.1 MAG: tRNA (adenosine(37)-N6)-threonylcarbamoyltransferase complex transferase subunit TsaD [Candidatus Brennerbacteria bacterium CG23_combo_of_CG06-09_8_20_14_all_44_41]PIR26255.1 MAG: tRNA (adenosine(37)-N6)-threonylcarbamoyltransferase complex transferase subunit TsaD [Candidatus Brennerbacteria bacterium CG11_big_fil_rev_8_21_14_0_20_43_10]PIX290